MTDPFALLGLSPTLQLDPDVIESAWRERRREGEDSDDLSAAQNEARSRLLDPAGRLEAWLALKSPELPADRALDPTLMDLFGKIGPVLTSADQLIERHRRSTTALAKAMLTRDAIAAQLAVQGQLAAIQLKKTGITGLFGGFETAAASGDFAEAARALGQLKFLKRWESQCQERLLALLAT